MIMNDTQRMIKNAIGIEYTNAITPDEKIRKGRYFNTLHEGYAVLLEEIQETKYETNEIFRGDNIDLIFDFVKDGSTNSLKTMMNAYITYCKKAMAELAQVAAVCQKMLDTIKMYYEEK